VVTLASSAPTLTGFRRAAARVLLGVLPLALLVIVAVGSMRDYFWDFRVFWHAGNDVLAGRSPYPAPDPAVLAHQSSFVYPPETALAFTPFALLPYHLAAAIFLVVLFASVPLTLWLLEVRDWRCYGAAFLMAPVLSGISNGAVSCLLALGLAAAWRYRDSWKPAAVAVAAVILAKVFLWPLGLWLVATRRWAAAAAALVGGALVTLASWAVLGFAGLGDYPDLLRILANAEQDQGYSPIALGLAIGLPSGLARGLAFGLGALAVVGIFVMARRRDGDRLSLTMAIAAALLLSPIVWLHYFILLLVPLALSRPRFSPAWVLLPLPFWFSSTNGQSHGHGALIAVALATASAILVASSRQSWRLPRFTPRRPEAAAPAAH
jgi:alpha-1,2-mannosyltransferase